MSSGLIPGSSTILGQLVAPSGTRMPLHQAAAPLGWSQDTSATMSDTAMRVNNASPSTGGSTGFSTWYSGGTLNMNAFSLSSGQLPSHNHTFTNNPSHSHGLYDGVNDFGYMTNGTFNGYFTSSPTYTVASANSNSDSNSANITLNSAGSGSSITPTYTTPLVKYADLIMAVKS